MKYIERSISQDLENHLFQGKVIVLYGPRRVGKTTLAKKLLQKYAHTRQTLYLNGDDLSVQQNLNAQTAVKLKQYIGDATCIVIDEAQRVKNIGINLKILIDTYPHVQIIATGSSSFDLANQIQEPLTGRSWEFFLPPLSIAELKREYNMPELHALLPDLLNYGMYPEVRTQSYPDKQRRLEEISKNYLFKDILDFEGHKNSDFIFKLLQLLAFQIGNEVSYNELGTTLGVAKSVIENYISLLEKSFVILRLQPFSRNLRKEVGKKRKIYFWDTGMRNALIQNFNDITLRSDIGLLWENFCIVERLKHIKAASLFRNIYYRRTYDGKEIDWLEEYDGRLHAYEIKWGSARPRSMKEFLQAYPGSTEHLINRDNIWDFAMGEI